MHEKWKVVGHLGGSVENNRLNKYIQNKQLLSGQRFLQKEDLSDDPTIRFGIKDPNTYTFKVISCLFSAYHALKRTVRAGKINVHSNVWLRSAWSVFAEVCKAEAGELRVHTRAFSLAQFADFLINGRLPVAGSNYLQQTSQ